MILFDEAATPLRLFCLMLILAGVVGLKRSASGPD